MLGALTRARRTLREHVGLGDHHLVVVGVELFEGGSLKLAGGDPRAHEVTLIPHHGLGYVQEVEAGRDEDEAATVSVGLEGGSGNGACVLGEALT
jgi:hypothetical protein